MEQFSMDIFSVLLLLVTFDPNNLNIFIPKVYVFTFTGLYSIYTHHLIKAIGYESCLIFHVKRCTPAECTYLTFDPCMTLTGHLEGDNPSRKPRKVMVVNNN